MTQTTTPSPFPTPSTPFPNALLDEVMPTLRDTEWRLLCVIVRQTLGWRDGARGGRKRRDWMSHRQLTRRTGRASGAISQGIEALVRRELIQVTDENDDAMLSPEQRRRSTRLYFRLGAKFDNPPQAAPVPCTDHATMAQSAMPMAETAIRNAQTTKTHEDKKVPTGRARDGDNPVDNCGDNPDSLKATPASSAMGADIRVFLARYRSLFRQRSERGELPPICWARDSRRVRQLLDLYPIDRLIELLDAFFHRDDDWIRRGGYSLGTFMAALPQLLVGNTRRGNDRR